MATPQQIAQKWFDRASTAGETIKQAVSAMTEADNPLLKAADRADAWLAGVQRAAANGSFQAGLRNFPFSQWKQAMMGKGVANYVNGLADGKQKMVRFQQVFQPFVAQAVAQLPPRGTLAQNKQRMNQMVDALATFSMSAGGGVFNG